MNVVKKIVKSFIATALVVALVVGISVPTLAATKHSVTFMYGPKSYVVTVDDGCSVMPPTDTYVPGYIFAGWVGNATNVTEDRIILGAYTKVDQPAPAPVAQQEAPTTKVYTVKFVDSLTGNTYWTQTVSEGAYANPPEVPHHEGYHFDRYDGDYTNVTSDRTITALYGMDAWDWHDEYAEYWWLYYNTDTPWVYEEYWWM